MSDEHAEPVMPATTHQPQPYAGPSREEVLAMRREFLAPSLLTYYRDPVMIVEGSMQWLFDETGRRYLDFFGGIVTVSVGHCHPRVVEKVREQVERLQHTTTIYLHPTIAEFGRKLASTMPANSGLEVCYFTSSGSEANELAMLMSRLYSGNFDLIALRNGYHGMTNQAMGLTGLHTWKQPLLHGIGVHHARLPDRLRGQYGYDDPDAGSKYADEIIDLIQHGTSGQIAGFIAEPIQGVGGTVEIPPGYLPRVYEAVRAAGGVCISDEVQTGFGRTGTNFWGFENHGVTPDIVTMAKGIGNGAPLGACVARAEVAGSMADRLHFNTYGGNPVSMAAGLATLDVMLEDDLQSRCHDIGGHLLEGLKSLQATHDIVGDARGQGLMLGLELVMDSTSLAPNGPAAAQVHDRAKDMGLLLGKGGLKGNVLRIKPPMCITREDCDFAIDVLDRCLHEVS
ncbi:aspartate aminotransferase family protein [bacterium]|nr:aspartate aminotransferase family protein [bacterium]